MAAPTKEQREQRKKIEAIIKRDADYYKSEERRGKAFSESLGHRVFAPYALEDPILFRESMKETDILDMIKECYLPFPFDHDSAGFFSVDYAPLFGIYHNRSMRELVDSYEGVNGYYRSPKLKKEETIKYLTEKGYIDENGALKESKNNLPIISLCGKNYNTNKSAYVRIDFTKPLDEIVSIVTKIKNDFEKNHNIIQTLGERLGKEEEKEVYKCDLVNCDIYTEKNPKPIEGRLIDALFIYDCKKFGLTNEYALNEINRYWIDVQNLFTAKMQENTRVKYLAFMMDLIENQKFESFLTGIKTK